MSKAILTKNLLKLCNKHYELDETITNLQPRIVAKIGQQIYENKHNPLYLVSEQIRHFFQKQIPDLPSYDEFKFKSPVVTVYDNFDSLLIPQEHVSRKPSDTYYVNANHVLRCHTSAHQLHCLEKQSKSFIAIADCYRRDEIDSRHFPVFHQCEVFNLYNHKQLKQNHLSDIINSSATSQDTQKTQAVYTENGSKLVVDKLKSTIEAFTRFFFDNAQLETRWVDAYFPFTHPSFELEIFWNNRWIEVLGCGIVRNEILAKVGLSDHIGFAAGFGLERFAMLKYQIPDIRLFWSTDSGVTHQFENKSPFDKITYQPISVYPQCINDISFWLPEARENGDGLKKQEFCSNDFYDLVRTVGEDLVEQVKLVDEFTHPKTKRTSHCYRIIYRAADRPLTKDEVNVIHDKIAETCRETFKVDLR